MNSSQGGGTKDTWVLAPTTGGTDGLMLARHAETLFWAGRYLERAEDTARMLDVTYHGLLEAMPWRGASARGTTCSRCSGSTGPFAELEQGMSSAATVSEFLVFDPRQPRRHRVGGRPAPGRTPAPSAS